MATKESARQLGLQTGYDIAKQNADDAFKQWLVDVVEVGGFEHLHSSANDFTTCETLTDYIIQLAATTESEHYRQFSPFEHVAHDFNEDEHRSEGIWEEYEAAVTRGARRYAKEYVAKLREKL